MNGESAHSLKWVTFPSPLIHAKGSGKSLHSGNWS